VRLCQSSTVSKQAETKDNVELKISITKRCTGKAGERGVNVMKDLRDILMTILCCGYLVLGPIIPLTRGQSEELARPVWLGLYAVIALAVVPAIIGKPIAKRFRSAGEYPSFGHCYFLGLPVMILLVGLTVLYIVRL
jgi:hypothetical protein